MKFGKSSFVYIGCAAFVAALIGCDSSDTDYRSYLDASGTVTKADGVTPASNLGITDYNWIIHFKDGSTVAAPFKMNAGFKTDAKGAFAFSSSQLQLQSGRLSESCQDVCVDYDYGYEDVCTSWDYDTYEYCSYYEQDEYGYEYCAGWDYETVEYCSSWETQTYEYCSYYAEDCDYYYPMREVSDIEYAYSEITYPVGLTSWATTQSQNMTYPNSIVSSSTPNGDDQLVDLRWQQKDKFVAAVDGQLFSARYEKLASQGKLKSSGIPKFGRTHVQANRILSAQLSKLTAAQRGRLETTRLSCGAFPRNSSVKK